MKARRFIAVMGLMLALLLAFSASAFAVVTEIVDPSEGNYLTETQKFDMSGLSDFADVSSLSKDGFTATFAPDPAVKVDWAYLLDIMPTAEWGDAASVEAGPRDIAIVDKGSPPVITIDLSTDVYEFGLEATHNDGSFSGPVTVSFYRDDLLIHEVTRMIEQAKPLMKARLFAIKGDEAFNRVVIASTVDITPAISQIRFSLDGPTAAATVSGTVKSDATGVGIPFAHLGVWDGATYVTDLTADYAGRYSVALPPASYTFHVTGPGWAEEDSDVDVASQSITRDFELADHGEQVVYRFFNMKGGVHFYTASDAEFINVYANLGSTFKYDGPAYFVDLDNTQGQVPLYRFFNRRNGVHFYTASEAEKTRVQTTLASTYNFEGMAYGVRTDGVGRPVYRFYVPARNAHFYTVDTGEIFNRSSLSNSYHYEGIGYWVDSTPD